MSIIATKTNDKSIYFNSCTSKYLGISKDGKKKHKYYRKYMFKIPIEDIKSKEYLKPNYKDWNTIAKEHNFDSVSDLLYKLFKQIEKFN